MRHLVVPVVLVLSCIACSKTPGTGGAGGSGGAGGAGGAGGSGGAGGAGGTGGTGGTGGIGGTGGSGGVGGTGGTGGSSPYGLDQRPDDATCKPFSKPATTVDIAVNRVFPSVSFQAPVLLLPAPDDHATFYVLQQTGQVVRFPARADVKPADVQTVVDITDRVAYGGETGLLGMAFHPKFTTNGKVYLSYTTRLAGHLQSRISVFTMTAGVIDPSSEAVLLTIDQPFDNHNGGNIVFGPDGYLYAGYGDGGSGGDPMGNGQNVNTLLGKMLRIDVDHGSPYAIPADNPFAGGGGKPEIYAYGMRNPWRWSFDSATGDLWVGDVGQNKYEEVDLVEKAGNYGWNLKEGFHCYLSTPCDIGGLIDPVVEYGHDLGNAVTGGYVYRGKAIPDLVGTYLFADYGSGRLFRIVHDDAGKAALDQVLQTGHNLSSFGQDWDGELYLVDLGGGLYRIEPNAVTGGGGPAPILSQTGCVEVTDPTTPTAGLVPYEIRVPFWSDGAEKHRWMKLPAGTQATAGTDGDLDLPNGTVLMKEFRLDGKRVETRLLVRHEDGSWSGASYAWNDAGSDADLVPGGDIRQVGSHSWVFPSPAQCDQCHTQAAGHSLGLELAQLQRTATYPSTGRTADQVATWIHVGLLAQSTLPEPLPDETAPAEGRARAWLHANCSFCHRPTGPGGGSMDLRFGPLSGMNVCNVAPGQGDLGMPGAKLLTPGDPVHSILSARIHRRDAPGMPPLASLIVDQDGTGLVDAWIASLSSCPQ